MIDTLIFGTLYLKNKEQVNTAKCWYDCLNKYNPGVNWVLIDSSSPQELIRELVNYMKVPYYKTVMDVPFDFKFMKNCVLSFGNNIGHLARDGRDGWGRAFCQGIRIAINNNFKTVIHIEGDLLFKGNVDSIVEKHPVITVNTHYGMIETGLMIMDVGFLKQIDFLRKYQWQRWTKNMLPENIVREILSPKNILIENWKGGRDDNKDYTAGIVKGMQYLTHTTPEVEEIFCNA